ncbi:MAG: outer membrane lipoprotein-sorting protein [Spirochaetaceae bacterium]|jgi:outer membrane lipoprotein-sorting protein|nr:outer membrane lipoprotein-sorting protein [Spirochaetaceae bacterium]
MMKLLILLGLIIAPQGLIAQNAGELVQASRNRIVSNTISTRSRMVITAKGGGTTERLVDQYEKSGPRGNRTIIVFQNPPNVAGTRFLTMDNPGNPADRWIFLPSLGKVRRIAGSNGGDSFMGTDLSYDDVSSMKRDVNLDSHTLLREDSLKGLRCFVIESVPKDTSYQYSKMIQWIDKSSLVNRKVELYDRRGALVKVLEILELKDVQDRLTPVVTRMTTVSTGTFTTIYAEIIKYNDPIPEGVFTIGFLETGRPS